MEFSLENKSTKALTDKCSEVNCISETFYEQNMINFKECEKLTIVGMPIIGATVSRPIRIKTQSYAKFSLDDYRKDILHLLLCQC